MKLRDDFGLTGFGFIICAAVGTILFVAIVLSSVIYGGRAIGRPTCRRWSVQTGIPTKFVVLNAFDSGTCLARTPSGRWVRNGQWLAFVNGTP